MAHITAKKTLAAAALAAASFTTPAFAQSVDYTRAYEDCRTNTDEQVIGGLIGAVAGGVFGSQVAARGARSEGSALGAILGGVAGAAIADGANDCDKFRDAQERGVRAQPVTYTQPVTTSSAPVYTQTSPVTTGGYPQSYPQTVYTQPQTTPARTVYTSPRIQSSVPAPVYTPPAPVYTQPAPIYTQPVSTVYAPQPVVHVAHVSNNRLAELSRIDRSIEQLEHKCAKLTRKQRRRFSHQRALELDYIAQEIAQLRRERSYIKTASRHDRRW